MNNLFVYGTLMFSEIAQRVIGLSSTEKAELEDFARYKIIMNGEELFYPAVKPETGKTTNGILFRELTSEQINQLDIFEGTDYRRKKTMIKTDTGGIQAWVYIWNNPPGSILAGEWNPQHFYESLLNDFIRSESL